VSEFGELCDVLKDMILVHVADKKLDGDCIDIDRNFELSTNKHFMAIKPDLRSGKLYEFDAWVSRVTRVN
jgi:hypothetical protein